MDYYVVIRPALDGASATGLSSHHINVYAPDERETFESHRQEEIAGDNVTVIAAVSITTRIVRNIRLRLVVTLLSITR